MSKLPKVSIIITSYNHEEYISEAIESVLMQKGDLFLEVIIGDDCSTDNTRSVIQKYERRFPELIRVLPSIKNLGSTQNLKRCIQACTGDYIAICEGDDYWLEPYKIVKQVEFLENRIECALCFNAIVLKFETTGETVLHHAQSALMKGKDAFSLQELVADNFIGNFSCCMYRKYIVNKFPDSLYDMYTVDWMFNMFCSQYGMIGFVKEPMSVYRIHGSGAWSGKDAEEKNLSWIYYSNIYDRFFNYKYHSDFEQLRKRIYFSLVAKSIVEKNYKRIAYYVKNSGYQLWIFKLLLDHLTKYVLEKVAVALKRIQIALFGTKD